MKALTKNFGTKGIKTFDRGFDNKRVFDYLIKNNEKFVIRARVNRNVIHKGKSKNILATTNEYKGKYSMTFKKKDKNLKL
ncbi:MAG: hypothetical protein PF487_04870 [Bacteroidales bacterium]|nr:hypothetical protein [Bacteroidales bacterium]